MQYIIHGAPCVVFYTQVKKLQVMNILLETYLKFLWCYILIWYYETFSIFSIKKYQNIRSFEVSLKKKITKGNIKNSICH